ncbi:4745_t:CDS:1, partial [Racocetra fulgida]
EINQLSSPSTSAIASSENELISSDDDDEFEISYKLIVKTVEGSSLLAKWFKESVSAINEFLSSIHDKIVMLTKDDTLVSTDYSIAFKTQREAGASTQLADVQDFIKFKAESIKLAEKNTNVKIYITIVKSTQIKQKNLINIICY